MTTTLGITAQHFLQEVLPRVDAYEVAEGELSSTGRTTAFDGNSPASVKACSAAFDLAVALDGLADRLAHEAGLKSRKDALATVRPLCRFTATPRPDALDRNTGVAVAYKHYLVSDASIPVDSLKSVLCAGLGYGLDGFGVGKMSGPEVLVWDRDGVGWKYIGDAAAVLAGWSDKLADIDPAYEAPKRLFLGLSLTRA